MRILKNSSPIHTAHFIRPFFLSEYKRKSGLACETMLHPWLCSTKPWKRLHVDFAGLFRGRMYLLITDAHSKWPEITEMPSITASRTIDELRKLFSSYGLPEQIVTDNGPQFVSGICNICQAEWYKTHQECSIPSFYKWSHRKACRVSYHACIVHCIIFIV